MDATDTEMMRIWLTGWCLARRLPPPIALDGHWRVDVGLPDQKARYVFPKIAPELIRLATAIDEPWIYLKALVPRETLAALLLSKWRIDPPRFLMTRAALDDASPTLATGYRLSLAPDMPVPTVSILDCDGATAASGQVVLVGDCAIFNQIQTDPGHRRRGLGGAVMRALGKIARDGGARHGVLMATEEGHALYRILGWQVRAPYASAVIPDIQR